jgi:hypothetical protein
MKQLSGYLLLLIISLSACNTQDGESESPPAKEKAPEIILLNSTFPNFESEEIPRLLEEAGLCVSESNPNDTAFGLGMLSCSSRYFKVVHHKADQDMNTGFIVQVKNPLQAKRRNRVLVVEKHNDKFKIANDYLGILVEMRKTKAPRYDLVIAYKDSYNGSVSILHEWTDKGHYMPVNVLEIQEHKIKPELQDSLNAEYIDNFMWGY